jgi:hypothetical protein
LRRNEAGGAASPKRVRGILLTGGTLNLHGDRSVVGELPIVLAELIGNGSLTPAYCHADAANGDFSKCLFHDFSILYQIGNGFLDGLPKGRTLPS